MRADEPYLFDRVNIDSDPGMENKVKADPQSETVIVRKYHELSPEMGSQYH
jgi:hypothetical protein